MKKLFALLLISLPLAMGFTACNDDDDLPDVSTSLTVENARVLGDTIYIVQGDTLDVAGINIQNNEKGKKAQIISAEYHFAGKLVQSLVPPYGFKLAVSADPNSVYYMPAGKYDLIVYMNIAAEDKALAIGAMSYWLRVVASADDIPADAVATTTTNQQTFVAKQ